MRLRVIDSRSNRSLLLSPSSLSFGMVSRHGNRFVRYALVGGCGVLVNTGILYLLVTFAGLPHLLAAAISSEVSILTNFVLNEVWTFRDAREGSHPLRRAVQYNVVALGGMVITLGVLFALTTWLGMHYLIANLIAIGAATLSNYALNMKFTWNVVPIPQPIQEYEPVA